MKRGRACLLFLLGAWTASALADSGEPGACLSFAESLYVAEDWDGAITEYKRCGFLHPSCEEAGATFARIADAYRKKGDWERALDFYGRARAAATSDSVDQERRLDAAVVLDLRGERLSAETEYARLSVFTRHGSVRERAGILLALSQVRGRRWGEAGESLSRARVWPDPAGKARLDSLLRAGEGIRRPSPRRAKILSTFVPGLGQAYAGSASGALHALLLNGAFAALFGRAVLQENYAEAGFIILPFLHRYYMGNRETAARTAVDRYTRATEPTVEGIRAAIRSEFADGP